MRRRGSSNKISIVSLCAAWFSSLVVFFWGGRFYVWFWGWVWDFLTSVLSCLAADGLCHPSIDGHSAESTPAGHRCLFPFVVGGDLFQPSDETHTTDDSEQTSFCLFRQPRKRLEAVSYLPSCQFSHGVYSARGLGINTVYSLIVV